MGSPCVAVPLGTSIMLMHGPPWAAGDISSSTWNTSSPDAHGIHRAVSLIFLNSFLSLTFCPYWTCFARAAPIVAVGPGHALHGATGAVWDRLCPAWGSPGLASCSIRVVPCYQYIQNDAQCTHLDRMEENSSKRVIAVSVGFHTFWSPILSISSISVPLSGTEDTVINLHCIHFKIKEFHQAC